MGGLELEFARSVSDIPREEWDGLAGPVGNPLLSWGFLSLLEASGSMTPETGWTGAHVLARRDGKLVAAAPMYLKSHSWGEFVFDFEFADLAESLGASWYPKLVGVVPATPAPAWRVLARPGEGELRAVIVEAAVEAARAAGLGGVHFLWPEPETAALLRSLRLSPPSAGGGGEAESLAEWEHQAFLWTDEGYGDFGGYLDSFSKNMRRNVRRERETVRSSGTVARVLGPREAASWPGLLDAMAELYESHNAKFGPWAARFLESEFFLRLPEFLPDSGWAIAAAFEGGPPGLRLGARPIALAFFLEARDRLYGRFWGVRDGYGRGEPDEVPGLHFELCYYLPIEYCLAKGIPSFDPGMGSPHKTRRGFRSIVAPSFHLCFDRRLSSTMRRILPELNEGEEAEVAALNEDLPFRR